MAMLENLFRDLLFAVRSLRRTPIFTGVALLTLALGIGANTAIFSVLSGVILRALPYHNPDQLMHITADFSTRGFTQNAVSPPEYLEFRQMNQSFAAVGAYTRGAQVYTTGEVNLVAGDRPVRARSISVDPQALDALGIRPAQGRSFNESEISYETRGLAAPVAILSHELWQSAFGGEPLVGQALNIDGRLHEVLGIMPPGTDIMDNHTEIWLPIGFPEGIGKNRNAHVLYLVGRLKDGVTPEAAQNELDAFLGNWAQRAGVSGHVPVASPSRAADHSIQIRPLQDAIVGDARRSIWLLQIAVGLVLLIACANLANLLLARAESRRREFALRAALGASKARLRQQTLAEGLLLSVAGGALGLWLAAMVAKGLVLLDPTIVPRLSGISIDMPVLVFALGISMVTGVLFGLAPAATRWISDVQAALKESGDHGSTPASRHTLRGALVVGEVAMAVMLLAGAGLLIQTVYNLVNVDAGFDRSRLVTFSVTLAEPYDPDTRLFAYQRLVEKLSVIPGVQHASIMSGLPPDRPAVAAGTVIENYMNSDGRPVELVDYYQAVVGDYFATMGIPMVAGRSFEAADATSEGRVVVVNETLATKVWKNENPIGKRLRPNYGALGFANSTWHTVVGIAKDVKQGGVAKTAGTELYIPLDQLKLAPPTMNVVLRTSVAPEALATGIQQAVREVDRAVPVVRLRDMETVFDESIRRPRVMAFLLGAFAGLALMLAAVGTFGVISYLVSERRRELGIRLALGAGRASVFTLVMRHGLALTMTGIAIGVVNAFIVNRFFAVLLYGVQPADGVTLGAVVATITLVAALACWIPSWRASRLNPNQLLRNE